MFVRDARPLQAVTSRTRPAALKSARFSDCFSVLSRMCADTNVLACMHFREFTLMRVLCQGLLCFEEGGRLIFSGLSGIFWNSMMSGAQDFLELHFCVSFFFEFGCSREILKKIRMVYLFLIYFLLFFYFFQAAYYF